MQRRKIYAIGIVYILVLYGFSLKEIMVVTLIAPRMARLLRAMSVGGIIAQSYSKSAQVTSGIYCAPASWAPRWAPWDMYSTCFWAWTRFGE
ncbi:MAG: hypothetical protein JEZ02_21100 [Desulfatibacillum sp.]|nr:hypothetical protein [Desulfatibacillum sp.]